MSVKVSLQQWDLPLAIIKWMRVKKYVEKRLLKMFLTEDEVMMGYKDTHQNMSARFLTLLIFAVGLALCVDHNPNTSQWCHFCHSVKCFNPLKLYPLSGNIFRKWFALYFLFSHEHLIIMSLISNGISYCCKDTFTDVRFSPMLAKSI